jgi:hypothetical protein
VSESANVFQDNDEFWDYVAEHPRVLGIPVSETKGLDLLNALRDVRIAYQKDLDMGDTMLTLLGTLLLGIVNGDGEQMLEEVIVSEAMVDLDTNLKEILDEGN